MRAVSYGSNWKRGSSLSMWWVDVIVSVTCDEREKEKMMLQELMLEIYREEKERKGEEKEEDGEGWR